MIFEEITLTHINQVVKMYVETFNASPWNDEWTIETASKRLHQMINCESAYGLVAYEENLVCGMILGSEEQYYNGIVFNIKEFCVKNTIRDKGIGTQIVCELEKRLKEKCITYITLNTLKSEKTQGFYKKKGFKVSEEIVAMCKQL